MPLPEAFRVVNEGTAILSTNYWNSPLATEGKCIITVQESTFRLLLPYILEENLIDMREAGEVTIGRGPWPDLALPDALEITFQDGSDFPFTIWMDIGSIDHPPPAGAEAERCTLTVWTRPRGGKPTLAAVKPAWYRRVERIPDGRPRG